MKFSFAMRIEDGNKIMKTHLSHFPHHKICTEIRVFEVEINQIIVIGSRVIKHVFSFVFVCFIGMLI